MEPITTVASTVATWILTGAFAKGGEELWEAIRLKFKEAGTEGLLTRAEKQPTEHNVEVVEGELVMQMEEDKTFANKLRELVKQLDSAGTIHSASGNIQTGASLKDVQITGGDSSSFNVGNTTQNN
jgi:hypothetical protein